MRVIALTLILVVAAAVRAEEPPSNTMVAPAGDLVVTEGTEWIQYEGPGLILKQDGGKVTLSYAGQEAIFLLSDIHIGSGVVWLRKAAVPLAINGQEVPQASMPVTEQTCRCSQCVIFLEYCCIPHVKYVGLCFGGWGCNVSCGSRRF